MRSEGILHEIGKGQDRKYASLWVKVFTLHGRCTSSQPPHAEGTPGAVTKRLLSMLSQKGRIIAETGHADPPHRKKC